LRNPEAAKDDEDFPVKLNDSKNLSKFIENVLPGVLEEMKEAHGWSGIPRTVLHDKASYMVSPLHDRLNETFSDALKKAGMRSWVGGESDSAKWLAPKLGDLYFHETAISHIRRLLATTFPCKRIGETRAQFRARLDKVEAHMNSEDFAAKDGTGLEGLAKDLLSRCTEIIEKKGERLPK
jgi:hypothetical protein